ncbi:hypothetical protein OAM97_01375 [Flavobacteriaceae bacterium]|nr:hypothetical protein [Flavobacteriaceae bacterium]
MAPDKKNFSSRINLSGNLIELPAHLSFRWENGEIVEEVHLFDPTLMKAELELFASSQE